MMPLVRVSLRGESGPVEPYGSSSFRLSNTKRGMNNFMKQNFHKLETDTGDAALERNYPLSIRQTIDIDIHEEDSMALHSMVK